MLLGFTVGINLSKLYTGGHSSLMKKLIIFACLIIILLTFFQLGLNDLPSGAESPGVMRRSTTLVKKYDSNDKPQVCKILGVIQYNIAID